MKQSTQIQPLEQQVDGALVTIAMHYTSISKGSNMYTAIGAIEEIMIATDSSSRCAACIATNQALASETAMHCSISSVQALLIFQRSIEFTLAFHKHIYSSYSSVSSSNKPSQILRHTDHLEYVSTLNSQHHVCTSS